MSKLERTGTYPWDAPRQILCTDNIGAVLEMLVQQSISPIQTNSQEKQAIMDLAFVRKYDALLLFVDADQLDMQYVDCCMEALK